MCSHKLFPGSKSLVDLCWKKVSLGDVGWKRRLRELPGGIRAIVAFDFDFVMQGLIHLRIGPQE